MACRALCGVEVRHSRCAGSCLGLGFEYKKGEERAKEQHFSAQLSTSKPPPPAPREERQRKRASTERDSEPQHAAKMSRSPERISSYRRHFEECSSTSLQVRVSSPSPSRRDPRQQRAASSSRSAVAAAGNGMAMGHRTVSSSRKSLMGR